MRKILICLVILLLVPFVTPSCASPNANYVDGPDASLDGGDIDYINVTQGWINVTYLAVPDTETYPLYYVDLSDDGTNLDAQLDHNSAVLDGTTFAWDISATVSGWGAVYFRTYVLFVDGYPNDNTFAGPDPDALPELPTFLLLPLLVSLFAVFSLYRRQ